jgi:hypothetical protein
MYSSRYGLSSVLTGGWVHQLHYGAAEIRGKRADEVVTLQRTTTSTHARTHAQGSHSQCPHEQQCTECVCLQLSGFPPAPRPSYAQIRSAHMFGVM